MTEAETTPDTREALVSQIPAVDLLVKLGFRYLPPAEARELRGGRRGQVLLEPILRQQLSAFNRVKWKGVERPFTADAIDEAIASLRDLPDEGLIQTSEKVFDLLSLGRSLPQTIGADTRHFTLRFIDWQNPQRNVFHVTEEYAVERSRADGRVSQPRLDVVLFVNGIPFAVIECKKRGAKTLDQAISDLRTYQRDDEIPRFFWYAQILVATNSEAALYATARTPKEFWAHWRENRADTDILNVLQRLLDPEEQAKMHWRRDEGPSILQERTITEQDRTIYGLLRPERLLEMVRHFIIYDGGVKKIARHQQVAAVKSAIRRVLERDPDGVRLGGLIWHTQGSGKSLTMVMLAKALALHPDIPTPRLILVTDRVELDKQIADTFKYCGYEPQRARDGRHLRRLLEDSKSGVITTIINKFEAALKAGPIANVDENTFVLVDEAHRSHFGAFHALMKKALKGACYVGFTGTPVVKDPQHNNLTRFGGFIHTYTLDNAVWDKAVVPLLYEGRHVEQNVDDKQLDLWFERLTQGKTKEQKADFKKKFANAEHLNRADQRLRMIAYDVASHFTNNFGEQGCKGQLVAPRKDVALRYKELLDEIGRMDPSLRITSEVLISGPTTREDDEEELPAAELPRVEAFWKEMMTRFGSEERYNESLTTRFKNDSDPQIIIVVSKLLTGFDAPSNTVLYLDKKLTGHTLLQAISRVNRTYEGKDYGYIVDYYGILGDLNKALSHYDALANFDEKDIEGALTPIADEIAKLPQAYSELMALFSGIKNQKDNGEFKKRLTEQDQRDTFYERLSRFGRLLHLALSSARWQDENDSEAVKHYKDDLRYFLELRAELKRQYAEVVDYAEYEKRIQHLIDRHIGATEVTRITPLVNIFDKEAFAAEVERVNGDGSKAETIANRMNRTIREKWEEDPAYYKRFSELLAQLIRSFKERRISENEYLKQVKEQLDELRQHEASGLPLSVADKPVARAFYGTLHDHLAELATLTPQEQRVISEELAHQIQTIVLPHANIVDWEQNVDVQNVMLNEIEDALLEAAKQHRFQFPSDHHLLDRILDEVLRIVKAHHGAKRRS